MKVLCLVAVLALAVSAIPIETEEELRSGENGWFLPAVDGSFQWVSTEEGERRLQEQEVIEGRLSTTPVNFYLFTKRNPTNAQEISASGNSVSNSNFNKAHPTRIVIHGWTQSWKDPMNTQIRDAWFTKGDMNIIIVDWARARSIEYASSVLAVPTSGEKVGNMINYLVRSHGMNLGSLEVIGHSLGAHVAGYAGKSTNTGKIHAIVGLDPALPLYSYNSPNKRLSTSDANYVESIQTCGGMLGFLQPIGKGSFYPNGGKAQPGCGLDATGSCAHGRSVTYYVEAIRRNDFPTMKCNNYEDAVKKSCGSTYSSVRMGATSNAYMVAGDYYVPVNSQAPFGKGN